MPYASLLRSLERKLSWQQECEPFLSLSPSAAGGLHTWGTPSPHLPSLSTLCGVMSSLHHTQRAVLHCTLSYLRTHTGRHECNGHSNAYTFPHKYALQMMQMQLMIIFMINSSVDFFSDYKVNCSVHKISEKNENCPSQKDYVQFCPAKSIKPTDILFKDIFLKIHF